MISFSTNSSMIRLKKVQNIASPQNDLPRQSPRATHRESDFRFAELAASYASLVSNGHSIHCKEDKRRDKRGHSTFREDKRREDKRGHSTFRRTNGGGQTGTLHFSEDKRGEDKRGHSTFRRTNGALHFDFTPKDRSNGDTPLFGTPLFGTLHFNFTPNDREVANQDSGATKSYGSQPKHCSRPEQGAQRVLDAVQ